MRSYRFCSIKHNKKVFSSPSSGFIILQTDFKTIQNSKKSFERIQITDKIKTEYCEKHNIPLLRLPFWVIEKEEHGEKIQEFIDNLSIKSNELNN